MGVFNFMETSFIISLGITFVLILLLIYHFKQRLTVSETKQDTMFEIINNLAQELNNVKGHIGQLTMISRPPTPFPFNNVNNDIKFSHEKIAQNDEPEQESMEYDEDESEEYSEDDERIIVSDEDDDDDISVEELSDDEEENNSQSVEIEDIETVSVNRAEPAGEVVQSGAVEKVQSALESELQVAILRKAAVYEKEWISKNRKSRPDLKD